MIEEKVYRKAIIVCVKRPGEKFSLRYEFRLNGDGRDALRDAYARVEEEMKYSDAEVHVTIDELSSLAYRRGILIPRENNWE